jgi:preprotein translocase subunit SecF
MSFEFVDNLFENKKYLYLMIIPAIIFVIAIISVFFVQSSIDLQGGVLVIMQTENSVAPKEVENKIKSNFGIDDVKVTVTSGLVNGVQVQYMQPKEVLNLETLISDIEKTAENDTELAKSKALEYFSSNNLQVESKELENLIKDLRAEANKKKNVTITAISEYLKENYGAKIETLQVKEVAPTLGHTFYKTGINVGILAFVLIAITVFICFRKPIPCLAVILSGILDVLGGVLGMAIVGVPLSLVTIPALLMLVGYSIDTDVMLTAKLLKQQGGSVKEKTKSALKTGLTMTITTLAAVIVMLIISYIWSIPVLFDMSVVLTFGLIVDIISTWLMNAPILLWYVESIKK